MGRIGTPPRMALLFWELSRIPFCVFVLRLIEHYDPGSHEAQASWLCIVGMGLLPLNLVYCLGPLAEYYFLAFGPSRSRWPVYLLRLALLAGILKFSVWCVWRHAYVIVYGI